MNVDHSKIAQDLAQDLTNILEMLAPIEEAARGYKVRLEKEGWSPTAAEQMALQLYSLMMMKSFGVNL